MTRVVRAADAVTMPWKNGGGTTREYVVQPGADPFEWRLSVAEVAESGPFSFFPGIDRLLVLLSGAGMVLHTDGIATPLRRHAAHRFPGEQSVHAELVGGATTDLNLFWRRDRWEATALAPHAPCTVPATDTTIVYVASGEVRIAVDDESTVLVAGDAMVFHHTPASIDGVGEMVVFSLRSLRVASP